MAETEVEKTAQVAANVQKKSYIFRIRKRYDYTKAFVVKKKIEEARPTPLKGIAGMLQPLIDRFAKKK